MMDKPNKCCAGGTSAHTVPMCIGRRSVVEVDFCVSRLVAALEAGGFRPVASCCGHGKMPASVLLDDGLQVVVLTGDQAEIVMSKGRIAMNDKELHDLRELAYGMSVANLNPEDVADYMAIASACARMESRRAVQRMACVGMDHSKLTAEGVK